MSMHSVRTILEKSCLGLALAIGLSSVVQAELIFTAPPRETPEVGQRIYGPIAKQLTELLGQPVVYEHPRAWQTYSFEMRSGRYDVVFDGPHFGAWRMVHLDHVPLVKLPGSLVFVVITGADNDAVTELDDLRERKVCGLASPNLATMTLLSQFPNPVRQPIMYDLRQGGFKAVYGAWKEGKCEAAVLRKQFFTQKVSDEDKSRIKVLFTSKPVPSQTITAGPKITASQRNLLVKQWTSEQGAKSASELFARFSKKSTKFLPAEASEYENLNLLLEGMVWGW